jgi:hypothetical protein
MPIHKERPGVRESGRTVFDTSAPAWSGAGRDIHMSKVKVVLMSLVAVFAVSAFASVSASAGPTHIFKVEGTELKGTESLEVVDDSFSGKLETIIAKLPIAIQCEEDISSGTIKANGESTAKIEFKNCFVAQNEKGKKAVLSTCTVTEPVIAEAKDELTAHSIDTFKGNKVPATETFTELKIGVCAAKGTFNIKGAQVCSIPESEYEKVIHAGICAPAESTLKQEKEGTEVGPAQLFGEEQIKLANGKNWSAT